jgi:hypothetical protein
MHLRLIVENSKETFKVVQGMVELPRITFMTRIDGLTKTGSYNQEKLPLEVRKNLTTATLEPRGGKPFAASIISPERLALYLAHEPYYRDPDNILRSLIGGDPHRPIDCTAFVALVKKMTLEDHNKLPLREGPQQPGDFLSFIANKKIVHHAIALESNEPRRTFSKLGRTSLLACIPEAELAQIYGSDLIEPRIPIR